MRTDRSAQKGEELDDADTERQLTLGGVVFWGHPRRPTKYSYTYGPTIAWQRMCTETQPVLVELELGLDGCCQM